MEPEVTARVEREMEERAALPLPPTATIRERKVNALRFMAELGKEDRERLLESIRRDADVAVMRVFAARESCVPVIGVERSRRCRWPTSRRISSLRMTRGVRRRPIG